MELLITIDIGTTAVRIVAFDFKGEKKAYKKGSYPTFHPQPDFSEQDPEQVFITVLFILKSLLNELFEDKKNKIKGIVFSSSMHSVLPIDKNGTPLGNALIWADNRAKKEAEKIKNSALGKIIYEATGTPIHAMSPLAKIAWIRENDAERFQKTYKFISLKEYVVHQFTNEYIIDYSLASATGLFNIRTLKWEQNSLDISGINENYLSETCPIYNSEAKLKPNLAKSLRLSANTKIILGSTDGCMATIGTGVFAEGQATISINSSGAVRVFGEEVLNDSNQRLFNYVLDKNQYISGGPTNNAGVVLDWFVSQFGSFQHGKDFEETMLNSLNEALHVSPGAEGLIFLPYLLGERAPIWNSNARGAYFGINIKHEPRHFVRATIEGIIFELFSIGKVIETYRNINEISLTGTVVTLPFWSNLVADIFGKKVNMNHSVNSINLGSALVGLTEMGVYANIEEAVKSIVKPDRIIEPKVHHHELYTKYYRIFSQLTQKFKEEFDLIAELQAG
ncbi:gluconate kinase [Emticicia aquatilis]|uniref:Gluconate kinase n=1 Tax=Emticicia aquatilis TaxID=1537369 RepID=A0A917DNV8_9BACT|nr:gluconokinase [Emticicia aquatilis]GGD52268.1 gluconate kinase [Emticicia aquatilis]